MSRLSLPARPGAFVAAALVAAICGAAVAQEPPLRVCADPNNMPYSNDRGEGFENRLAELVADRLGTHVEYTWHAHRRGFLRRTLNAGACDVVIGVPNNDMIGVTRPYYRSSYAFVSRADRDLDVTSINAPELEHLTIGVHLVGDDGANTPAAHALAARGIVENVKGYMVYGDYREEAPPMRLLDAVVAGDVDIAVAWGPQAGWYAQSSRVPLRIVPILDGWEYLPQVFQFAIAMGVRKEDEEMKAILDEIIVENRQDIRSILESYGVPVL